MQFLSGERRGTTYAILSGLFYGLLGYFGVSIIDGGGFSVYNMQFWRFVVACAVMLPFILPKIKAFRGHYRELLKAFLSGAAFYGTSATFFFLGSQYIGTGLAMVIFFTHPIFVILFGWLMHRAPIPKVYFFAVGLIMLGLTFFVDTGEMTFDLIGIGFAILGAIFYCGYILTSKKSKLPPMISTFVVLLGCAVTCFIFANIDGTFEVPQYRDVWANILGLGIICTTLPVIFMFEGLKTITAEKAAILSVLEPVFVAVCGVLLLGEKITFAQSIGIVTVLSGALITLVSKNMIQKAAMRRSAKRMKVAA
ncbi:MAG: EamA/RhaT family transporter [Verrucomicrobia bacterium CG_4_10_14_3_um_filter_43_23]|nr:MAG: hypothetical protein AUJ82_08040 [Verrucomicrobia bacterium CG1_02_43_26]PIP59978.1 MAG: EamA family transporter [Verrucomicrobia bacterium CG22_combo_CG10-13_8_21_14_all_43_17]PIX58009.1 MAG: EamA/RhaT family transporter [Verrucomicrobia bacterium CG_4_10_14_3_um_filter_43_23]PIY61889.1 MAG: EamA/RhaT family transporter [Verrucomicrobia bacterium CG_4_10_14_0_8_um_filter_43_34]PJA43971.1 MAG: EamA/RhaT family transporter [Verrucomicrobia bacterium CG_4_9_14_3_um_filter_43_20]